MGARVHHIVPHTCLVHAKLPSNCPECRAWGNLDRFETDFRVQKIFFRRDPPNFEGSLRNFGGRVRKATGRGTNVSLRQDIRRLPSSGGCSNTPQVSHPRSYALPARILPKDFFNGIVNSREAHTDFFDHLRLTDR